MAGPVHAGGTFCCVGKSELGRNTSLVAWGSDLSDVGRNRSLLPGISDLGRNRSLVAWESELSDAGRNRSLELPGDLAWEGTDLWSCLVTPGASGVATASMNAEERFVVGVVSRR